MKRSSWCVIQSLVLCLGVVAGAETTADPVVRRIEESPAALRESQVLRELRMAEPSSYRPVMARIATDPDAAWDLRARALTFLGNPGDEAVTRRFAADFSPSAVAGAAHGAAAFNILAEWLRRSADPSPSVRDLIVPKRGEGPVAPVLESLRGHGIHQYLRWLYGDGFIFRDSEVEILAATDDQLTRQFLCWLVGEERRVGMDGFLVAEIASSRSSSYRTQVDRMFVAALTLGIGEIIRQAAPTPRWLEDDATPKGLALESLGVLLPESQSIDDPDLVTALVEAAASSASGKDRGQWQLAIDILDFLRLRQVELAGTADGAVESLARQVLRKRGPLEAFVAAERLHRLAGATFPELSEEDAAAVWDECLKTLNAEYLGAVTRAIPDPDRRQRLEVQLLEQGKKAAVGSLRVVRCWGADLEGPGDWALAVSELHLTEAVPAMVEILDSSWNDEAAMALARMGAEGAAALAPFLRTPAAWRLDREVRDEAVAACAEHLSAADWLELRKHLLADPYLAESVPPSDGG